MAQLMVYRATLGTSDRKSAKSWEGKRKNLNLSPCTSDSLSRSGAPRPISLPLRLDGSRVGAPLLSRKLEECSPRFFEPKTFLCWKAQGLTEGSFHVLACPPRRWRPMPPTSGAQGSGRGSDTVCTDSRRSRKSLGYPWVISTKVPAPKKTSNEYSKEPSRPTTSKGTNSKTLNNSKNKKKLKFSKENKDEHKRACCGGVADCFMLLCYRRTRPRNIGSIIHKKSKSYVAST